MHVAVCCGYVLRFDQVSCEKTSSGTSCKICLLQQDWLTAANSPAALPKWQGAVFGVTMAAINA